MVKSTRDTIVKTMYAADATASSSATFPRYPRRHRTLDERGRQRKVHVVQLQGSVFFANVQQVRCTYPPLAASGVVFILGPLDLEVIFFVGWRF